MIRVYLAGKVPKGDEIASFKDWRDQFRQEFRGDNEVEFLTPVNPDLDETKPGHAFGFACSLVKAADVVVVDAGCRLGIGTAQEILVAKHYGKCVVCYLPKSSPHRRQNLEMHEVVVQDWIHPFIAEPTDYIFDNLEEVFAFLRSAKRSGILRRSIKGLDIIDRMIEKYELESRAFTVQQFGARRVVGNVRCR